MLKNYSNIMHVRLLISRIAFWYYILVDARPEDSFSLDSITEPINSVSDDIDLFSPQGLNDASNNDISTADLISNSATTTSEHDADTYNLEADNLFPADDHSVDTDPLLESSSACETDDSLDDGVPHLEARGGTSCSPSKPKENIDSIINLFQDPESVLRQNIPPTKVPVGQTNQPGQDDENFNLESFPNNLPVPFLFEEDAKKCPVEEFGLSTTPVCLNSLKGSAIRNLGSWFTLHDVEPCKSRFHHTIVAGFRAKQGINAAIDVSNAPSCPEDEELWCCREITSEVKFASFH